MTINERVKLLRESLGESQERFGSAIGISKSGVSNIESGIRSVTEKHIKLICMAYSVNEEWVRNGEEPMFAQDDSTIISQLVNEYNLDVYEKAMITAFLKMRPEQRSFLKEWVKASMQEVLKNEDTSVDASKNASPTLTAEIKARKNRPEAAEEDLPIVLILENDGTEATTETVGALSPEDEAELERYRQELIARKARTGQQSALPNANAS